MKRLIIGALGVVMASALAVPVTHADSISGVVGARAKDRAGARLTENDVEKLERYGSNDRRRSYGYPTYGYPAYSYGYAPYDYSYGYGSGYGYGYGYGGVGIGIGGVGVGIDF